MSRNSKNATRIKEAKSRNRKNGYKGPAKTQVKHNKRNAWYRLLKSKRVGSVAVVSE